MNTSGIAYVVLGIGFLTVGIAAALAKRGTVGVILGIGVAFCGPVLAFTGLASTGGAMFPPYAGALALVVFCVALAQLLICLAVSVVAWRHESATGQEDFDEVAV